MGKKNIQDVYRLSPLQQGLLFHSLYAPSAGEYVMQYAYALRGQLDATAFERAWRAVVERHPILRTSFHWEGLENWVQVVHRQVALPVVRLDWSALSADDQQRQLAAYLQAVRRRGFELERPPLMRLMLAHTGSDRYHFVWSFHHLLLDGWSLPVVLGDLFQLYHAEHAGVGSAGSVLGPAPPYRNYIAWLKRQDLAAAEQYWRPQLAGFDAPVEIGVGRRDGATGAGVSAGMVEYALGPEETAHLAAFARGQQLTLNSVVQGAWALALGRLSGRQDVVFGTTVSGRPPELSGVESMVGLFINTLPVRLRLTADEPVVSWLRSVRDHIFELRQFEYSPLSDVQRWSDVPQGTPLFDTILAYENFPHEAAAAVAGLEIGDAQIFESSHYPIAVIVLPEDSLVLRARYDRRRFTGAQASGLLRRLARALQSFAEQPEQRLGEVTVLGAAEQHQLLVEWNDLGTAYPRDQTIHGLFSLQAERTPDAPALTAPDLRLTYRQLDLHTDRLARKLRLNGVRPGDRVGLCLPRSGALVASMLGVLKAGAAYVPLDPGYPQERLAYLAAAADLALALTDPERADRLTDLDVEYLLLGDEAAEDVARLQAPAFATADSLAYILFTSGSTGLPKGAAIPHRAVVRLVCDTDYVTFSDEVFLHHSAMSFDASTFEMWGPLLHGSSLVVFAPERPTPEALTETIAHHGVTTAFLTPGYFHRMVEDGAQGLTTLRQLVIGGDVMSPPHTRRFLEKSTASGEATLLVNGYGPTETTVFACHHGMRRPADVTTPIPLGRPLNNTGVQLLDHRFEPVPAGVQGELCVAGDALARGYFGRPQRTAQSFVPDPGSDQPGGRLYRTGDRTRWLPGGRIEFLGRIDHQVKVRGFRIEPGEIEAALHRCPGVRQSVVIARRDEQQSAGELRLIAYVAHDPGAAPTASELRERLRDQLPEHMQPATFVFLDALPLTPIGKVDRRALPAPSAERPELESDWVAPRTDAEKTLAEIWAKVLRLEQVGVDDDFFELGGDSILSLQIISKARRQGLEITPRQFFEQPTVAALAALAESATAAAPTAAVAGPVPLTAIQHWFFEQNLRVPEHFNQAIWLVAHESLEPRRLVGALAALIATHDALRLRFERGANGWQATCAEGEDHQLLHLVELGALPANARPQARSTAAHRLQTSLDLTNGPLLRAGLMRGGDGEDDQLLLVIHHLAVDGVSWRTLVEDFETAYRQLGDEARAGAVELAPATPWAVWARRLNEAVRSGELKLDTEDWLVPGRISPALPLDHASTGQESTEASARTYEVTLRRAETQALLRELPAASGAQITDLLLTALAEAVGRWTGGDSLVVALEGHGREEVLAGVDLSRTVGWFTSLCPVVLEGQAGELPDRLSAVKESLRRLPHRGFDYGVARYLSDDSELTARLAAAPPPEISFNYLGQLDLPADDTTLFVPSLQDVGPLFSPQERRRHLFEVVAAVQDERLRITWSYSSEAHREATVERLAGDFLAALRAMLDTWSGPDAARRLIPSDFPLVDLKPQELERLPDWRIEDVLPLAPLQEGLLFHTLLHPELDLYVEQLCCALEGDFDPSVFESVWHEVMKRHANLRTAFAWEGFSQPVQIIVQENQPPLVLEDLSPLDAAEREARLDAWLRADRERGFALDQGPPLRLAFLRTGPDRGYFVWTYHHLLLDGWSLSLVLREVFDLYRARRRRQPSSLPSVRPYRNYLQWLDRQDRAAADDYWRQTFAGIDTPTPLGVDRAAPEGTDPAAERGQHEIRLSTELTTELDAFGRRHRLTLSTLVQGAWALLLQRYGGSPDVVFGTIVSGRPPDLEGAEEMVGLFINALPVRVRPSNGSAQVAAWLGDLQERLVELGQYAWCALRDVQAMSAIPQGEPLFESLLVFENYPIDTALGRSQGGAGSLAIREVRALARTDYPLALVAGPGEQLWLRLNYERQRFTATTVERALHHLETLLTAMVAAPERRLGELSPLTATQRHQQLVEWNDPTPYEIGPTLHQHFERQAAATPTAAAVIGEGRTWSFEELNTSANRLAHHLRQLGVGPGTCAGIALERCPEMVAAILGILKAGGAYVPLDPEHPRERLATIVEQTQIRALVTAEGLLADVPTPTAGCEVICVDRDRERLERESTANPAPAAGPDHLAYVMFTSGSTGLPKGVMIPHRGVVNRLVFAAPGGHLRPGDRFLQKASLGFDVSVLEIFLPLLVGGATVLARPGGHRDPAYLVHRMAEAKVQQAIFPPSLLRLLLAEDEIRECRELHSVASSADALPVELQEDFFSKLDADLYNRYGPTETSIAASSWKCVRGSGERSVPIGRPIARARLSVVRDAQPLPIGAAGELAIAGPGLARGYFGRPGGTAETFVPDPTSLGERRYLTGDLVRCRPDGAVEFLGRVDHQLKIRGYRVEPGEIEALLEAQETVREAVVIGREDRPGALQLVAYLVPPAGHKPDVSELRRGLQTRLPSYMVPAAFVDLDALPLSANGKVDRAALPAPVRPDTAPAAPRTSPEKALTAILTEVLDVEQVGVDDNFFALGGDSILSLRVASKAQEAGFQLTLKQIFEQPTVGELAAVMVPAAAARYEQGPVTGPVPLTPIQRRFLKPETIDPHHFNQALLLLTEPLDGERLRRAVELLLVHHDALRLRFAREASGYRQCYAAPGGPAPVHRVDLSALAATHATTALEHATGQVQRSLHLAQGPILRAVAFDLEPSAPGRLMIVAHHLAIDGVSWRIVLEDLEVALDQLTRDEAPQLAPKTASFGQAAERLVEIGGEIDSDELAVWLDRTSDDMPPLPADRSSEPDNNTVASTEVVRLALDAEATTALLQELPKFYKAQIDDVLLTALARACERWTGQPRLLVDLETHGREHGFEELDLTRTVGWLTVVYPLPLELDRNADPAQQVKSIRDRRQRIPRGGLAWGLVRQAPEDRRLDALPAAQISFNYLGRLDLSAAASKIFRAAPEELSGTRSGRAQRRYLLDVNGAVVEGRLELAWTFSRQVHRRATVEKLAQGFFDALRQLIEHTRSGAKRDYSPADFPHVKLNQSKLDKIMQKVNLK